MEKKVLIIGAGYCGLAAAHELINVDGVQVDLVEKSNEIGGLSRTIKLGDYKLELGPHVYFDKDKEVKAFWEKLAEGKYKSYKRSNRIFYQKKYINSPLSIWDTFLKLGPFAVAKILVSYLFSKFYKRPTNNAEDWVINSFGKELFNRFFKVYNEKIWGIDCSEIAPNWAGQRIKTSLVTMILKSLRRDHDFIIKTFDFPDGGSETLYNKQLQNIENSNNIKVHLSKNIKSIKKEGDSFSVSFEGDSSLTTYTHVIATNHLNDINNLIHYSDKKTELLNHHISKLRYRHMVLVNFIFPRSAFKNFNEHWIDVHDPNVRTLRVTNFSNYNFETDNKENVGVCLEYNCFEQDDLWSMSEEELVNVGKADLNYMDLITVEPVLSSVLKLEKSYPVYYLGYQEHTNAIKEELSKVDNLILAGRNAMYKWNNMHHSVKTGLLAARIIKGEDHDLEQVKGMVTIGKDSN